MRYIIFSLPISMVFLFGCQTGSDIPYKVKPTARILDFMIQETELDYATLYWEIKINNPNPKALSLLGLKYSLTSGGGIFLSATDIPKVIVAPNEQAFVSFTDRVLYKRLLRSLNSSPGLTIPYQLKTWLQVKGTKGRVFELSLDDHGHLELPHPPETKVDGKVVQGVDVIFIGTPHDVVERMLELAQIQKEDLVYDLGCGDGRVVVAAAKEYGCRATGYDIDPQRVKEARALVKKEGVSHLVTIEQKDLFSLDLSEADVVALYLDPILNERLIPQLKQLKPGARIVSHSFGIGSIEPDKAVTITSKEDGKEHRIFLWKAPVR